MAGIGWLLTPYLRAVGVLGANDPFRKVGFLVGLAMIFGAGIVDLTFIALEAVERVRAPARRPRRPSQSGGLSTGRLVAVGRRLGHGAGRSSRRCCSASRSATCCSRSCWCSCSCSSTASRTGISDWNPISSAFVVSVLLMSAIGLRDPIVAMMAASVLLVSTHRRRRHAAGPVDRLAAGIEARDPVPLPGGRHRDGRRAVRGAGEALHERVSGAAHRHVHAPRSEASASGSRR